MTEGDEENEEEFLSPESESEHEEQNEDQQKKEIVPEDKTSPEPPEETAEESKKDTEKDESEEKDITPEEKAPEALEEKHTEGDSPEKTEKVIDEAKQETEVITEKEKCLETTDEEKDTNTKEEKEPLKPASDDNEVSEAIEEPVMLVTGEGNGADCESSYIIGEEISEEVMFFYGEGSGYDNDTGNPEAIEQTHNSTEERTDEENGGDECLNGEHIHELTNTNSKNKLTKGVKLKSSVQPTVTKRALKKQSNDTAEVLKSDSKKHCIRNLKRSDSSQSNSKSSEIEKEGSVNDRSTTDSETPWKNRIKKGRGKVKKKEKITSKQNRNVTKEVINSVSETDNGHDSKASIIEKRKSSVSSVEQDDGENADSEKEKSSDKELKAEEPLPPKKLRLETTPESDINESHSNEPVDNVNNSDTKDPLALDDKDNTNEVENDPISKRKKIKASKGKFKRKKFIKNSILDKSTDKDASSVRDEKANKSLKRSLLDSTMSDKNKSESHSESEVDEPLCSGKRLKIRPKKIITSSR